MAASRGFPDTPQNSKKGQEFFSDHQDVTINNEAKNLGSSIIFPKECPGESQAKINDTVKNPWVWTRMYLQTQSANHLFELYTKPPKNDSTQTICFHLARSAFCSTGVFPNGPN
jgi:hypothetical protein